MIATDDPAYAMRVSHALDQFHRHLAPVRVMLASRAPGLKKSVPAERIVIDALGRKTAMAHLCDAGLAARLATMHHQQAMSPYAGANTLDAARDAVKADVKQAMTGLDVGRIEVTLRNNIYGDDAKKAEFRVDLMLLDDTLQKRASILILTSVRKKNDELALAVARQRHRQTQLGSQDALEQLTCCPVLAGRLQADDNPGHMARDIRLALTSESASIAFVDGVLHGRTQLVPGPVNQKPWWEKDTLHLREQMPETIAMALKGRPLGSLITHPWLPADAVITRASRLGKNVTVVKVDAAPVPFIPVHLAVLERGAAMRYWKNFDQGATQEYCRSELRRYEARNIRLKRNAA